MTEQAVRASEQQAYYELCAYTIEHARQHGTFIHQHVVDAYAAQHADEHSRPIGVAFALIGLYLHVEQGYSGKEVQRLHMAMGQERRTWPRFTLPAHRGAVTSADVIAAPPGPARDHAIEAWCRSVWHAFSMNRAAIVDLLFEYGVG
jgi:hypothetical protein